VTISVNTGLTDNKIKHGDDLSFSVNIGDGIKVTRVSYQVGSGETVDLAYSAEGLSSSAYTIKGGKITGDVSITLETTNTYTVTFAADKNGHFGDSDTTTSVTMVFSEGDTLTEDKIPTPVGNAGYTFDKWDTDPLGKTVEGKITYTASFKDASYSIKLPDGTTTSNEVTHGTPYTFTPSVSGKIVTSVSYTIGNTEAQITANADGSYTIDGDVITGDVTIKATTIDGSFETIDLDQFKAMESGKKIVVIKTDKLSGSKYAVTGESGLYYSSKYEGYVMFTDSTTTDAVIASKLSTASGDAAEIKYDGDISGNGKITAADAGIINDILHNSESLNYDVSDQMRLELDVLGDKAVTTSDIEWILEEAVGNHTTAS
jgi:hypothetical protein